MFLLRQFIDMLSIIGALAVVTLNRPKSYNSLNTELTQNLLNSVREASENPKVRPKFSQVFIEILNVT